MGALLAASAGLVASWTQASSSTAQVAPEPVAFRIELLEPEEPIVGITVEARGDLDGASEFTLAEGWAGIAESGRDLELVEARGERESLASERVNSYTWQVQHAPGESLTVTFELKRTSHRANAAPPGYYLPILEPGLCHLLGAQALPAPAHLDPQAARAITLEWRGFDSAGWKTISSYGATPKLTTTLALDGFRHALFLAGDLRLARREIHGRALWTALFGRWSFTDEEFTKLAAEVVTTGREFFADFGTPHYLISAIPVLGSPGSSALGGTGLTNSFALFMTPDARLSSGGDGVGGIDWLLSHELFHEWNGHVIRLAQPEQLAYWFSEGFTDFYARRLLLRGGRIRPEEYVASWNAKLRAFAANPERAVSGERVREAFWSEPAVGEVPYQRGDLIAFYVDAAIRARSHGERSLDDALRALVARGRAGGPPLTSAGLCDALAEFAGRATADAALRWALEGIEVPLPSDALGPEYELVPEPVALFDPGFDHEGSVKGGTIQGVRPGGPAQRAGLRDGMHFLSWTVRFGAVDQPVVVRVRDEGGERELSYLPQGNPVSGYRARAR